MFPFEHRIDFPKPGPNHLFVLMYIILGILLFIKDICAVTPASLFMHQKVGEKRTISQRSFQAVSRRALAIRASSVAAFVGFAKRLDKMTCVILLLNLNTSHADLAPFEVEVLSVARSVHV